MLQDHLIKMDLHEAHFPLQHLKNMLYNVELFVDVNMLAPYAGPPNILSCQTSENILGWYQ
jgi:hypothetical protein